MVLMISKGRSSTFPMLKVCRRLCALLLCTDSYLSTRWIPSELNVADKGSRRWEHLRKQHVAGRASERQELRRIHERCYPTRTGQQDHGQAAFGPLSPEEERQGFDDPLRQEACREGKDSSASGGQKNGSTPLQGTDELGAIGSLRGCRPGLYTKNRGLETILEDAEVFFEGSQELDEACTRFLNDIFEQGVEFHEGSKFVAAVKDAFPDYGPKGMLPRMVRALQGWGKVDPQKTRPPLPWELVASLAMKMRRRGRLQPALATLTMFTAHLRPGECLAIQKTDLAKPMPKQEFHTLHLHPAERHEASKVGISEESIQLDAVQVQWLGLALEQLQSPGPFLFDLGYTEMVSAWKQALVDVGLEHNHAVLHQLRHFGPSFDRCHRLRSLMEIKARGRWAADASLRRYEQHGRLNQEYHRLPLATQKLVLQLEEQMRKLGPKFFTHPQQ